MSDRGIPRISLTLRKKTGTALRRFSMIQPDDSVLIGLSGGKDSLALALVLAAYQRRSPVPFSLRAAFVDMGVIGGITPSGFDSSASLLLSALPHPLHSRRQRGAIPLQFLRESAPGDPERRGQGEGVHHPRPGAHPR
ncbi:hypothetical protein MASR2M79_25420 [Aminivibrio sp.]